MRHTVKIIMLTSILSISTRCSKDEHVVCISFLDYTFMQTYLAYFQDENVFLIKGIAMDINKHGREIKIIEDLKGNFDGGSNIFVWGASDKSFCGKQGEEFDRRVDYITQHQKNDTLIAFITKAPKKDIERSSDYATLSNYHSVVKLSNGYISGAVNNWGVAVSWNEFQDELQFISNLNEKPSWWSDEHIPDPFIVAYGGIYSFKNISPNPYAPDFFNSYFFVKGIVLETHNHGKKIKLINDLKGNFPEGKTEFMVWGTPGFQTTRFDDLTQYKPQDTLFMLLRSVSNAEEVLSNNAEKKEDYSTLDLTFSVLQLSDNFVTGHITSCFRGIETMPLEKFQELLNSIK